MHRHAQAIVSALSGAGLILAGSTAPIEAQRPLIAHVDETMLSKPAFKVRMDHHVPVPMRGRCHVARYPSHVVLPLIPRAP